MKKTNRNILIFLAGVFIGMLLLFVYRTLDSSNTVKEVEAKNLLEEVEAQEVDTVEELPESFIMSNTEFSLELFKELAVEENPVYSPVPVYLSLALLANGAEDGATHEILDTLNLTDLTDEEFNAYYHELINILEAESEGIELNISNSIWHDEEFEANADFLQLNKTYYDTDTFKLDFSDKQAPTEMNDWVSNATNGKIEKMIDKIGADTVMYLFSTIYFNGKWEMPFELEGTYESEFSVDGEILDVDKMTGRFEVEHIITDTEEGIILPYEGDQYSFIALMPNRERTVREYLDTMDQRKVSELLNAIEKDEVDILLPKFEVSFENKLTDTLPDMGIKEIFDADTNSLSKMGKAIGNLYVSEMAQKTFIEVNELGTEAASAVSSAIDMMSMPEPKPTIDFNRPFIYSIIDNDTGLPVFLGIMDNPEK